MRNGGPYRAGGFVLAGGESRRMGSNKALLEIAGKPLVLRAAELLRPLARDITILGEVASYAHLGLPILPDQYPIRGPLAGLCTGLKSAGYDWNLFLPCDLPLMEEGVLEILARRALEGHSEAVVPRIHDLWQPLCAAYHRSCLAKMEAAIREDSPSIFSLYRTLNVDVLTAPQLGGAAVCDRVFRNINTPQDWEAIQQLVAAGRE